MVTTVILRLLGDNIEEERDRIRLGAVVDLAGHWQTIEYRTDML